MAKYVVLCIYLTLASCAHRDPAIVDETWPEKHEPAANPLDRYRAAFALTWNGARIGYASERIRKNQFHRREEITVRRGDALVQLVTIITINVDDKWNATRVKVERRVGATITLGRADRTATGWSVKFGNEPRRQLTGKLVPLELLPLLLARQKRRHFHGDVLLSGYGFAVAKLTVAPNHRARQVVVTLATALGKARTLIDLTAEGTVARVHGEVGAVRISRSELGAPFRPPELVDSSSLTVAGTPPRLGAVRLAIRNAPTRLPPHLPGQRIARSSDGWRVTLLRGDRNGRIAMQPPPSLPTDARMRRIARAIVAKAAARSTRENIVALTKATRTMLLDDMSTPVHEARAALALGRGDCTSHSALLSALATAIGIPTRLVTGFRLDGDRLVRHRWVIAKLGSRWMAVDPTYGEAPARPRLLGLAVHDSSAAQLAIVDDMAFSNLRNVNVFVTR